MKFALVSLVLVLSTVAVIVEGAKKHQTTLMRDGEPTIAGLEEEIKEDEALLGKLAKKDPTTNTENEISFLEAEKEEAKQKMAELAGDVRDGEPTAAGLQEEINEDQALLDKLANEDPTTNTENEISFLEEESKEAKQKLAELRGGARRSRNLQSCSKDKRVKIVQFGINGDDDSGAMGEHQLKLGGKRYFPNVASDCKQDPVGFCEWREGEFHNIADKSSWVKFTGSDQLSVGTEEHDSTSENDSYSAILSASQWYQEVCAPYEITVAKNFKPEIARKFCINAKVSGTAGAGPASATAEVGAESCSEWVDPAESYIWLIRIEPWEESTQVYVPPAKKGNGGVCSKSNECVSSCCSGTIGGDNTCEDDRWYRKCVS